MCDYLYCCVEKVSEAASRLGRKVVPQLTNDVCPECKEEWSDVDESSNSFLDAAQSWRCKRGKRKVRGSIRFTYASIPWFMIQEVLTLLYDDGITKTKNKAVTI